MIVESIITLGFLYIVMNFFKIILPVKRPSGLHHKIYDADSPNNELTGEMVGLTALNIGRNV